MLSNTHSTRLYRCADRLGPPATEALRGVRGGFLTSGPVARRKEMQREGVHGRRQFLGHGAIDQPVALHKSQPLELARYGNDLEMRLGPRRNIVHMALIDHFEVIGCEQFLQFALNSGLYGARCR